MDLVLVDPFRPTFYPHKQEPFVHETINLEVCRFDLANPTTAGMSNDPTRAVVTTPNKEAQYSGRALKYAEKLPNLLTVSTAAGSPVVTLLKR